MARFEKYTTHGASAMLFHNSREFPSGFAPKNIDIDEARTSQNYSLCENATTLKESRDYYKQRLNEIYCYKNVELKTLGMWVVTAPADLAPEQEKDFFQAAHDYMDFLYGKENCVQSIVHKDEGIKNADGEIVEGKAHLHYSFVPAVENKKYLQVDKRGCISKQNHYQEKCCIHDIVTPTHLKNFNSGLQQLCDERGIKCTIANGATSGGNRTVAELKDKTRVEILTKENEHLREQVKSKEHTTSPWSDSSRSGWSKGANKEWQNEKEY